MNESYQPEPRPREDRPVHPKRRKRTKWQDFKEAWLPAILVAVSAVLCVTFIVGAVRRSGGHTEPESSSAPVEDMQLKQQQEQAELISRAAELARQYDYPAAMEVLNSYSAGLSTSSALTEKYQEYEQALAQTVPWTSESEIPNLAVRMLIVDLPRATANEKYGSGFNRNYLTTTEFSRLLEQLYANGYLLISPYDLASIDGNGQVTAGTVYLPADKKPIILTQLGTNFFTYMTDGDGDGLPDQDGSGFPYRLAIGPDDQLVSQVVDADGKDLTGSYDLVTILNDFVREHPDFSYRGARAVLAVTGYDGLFGYRTDPETSEKISPEFYDAQLREVGPVVEKLRADGYDIACMSYDYVNYAAQSTADVTKDLADWQAEVAPILGSVNMMVMPYEDLTPGKDLYTGGKYDVLMENGFRYFLANGTAEPWMQRTDKYARMHFFILGAEDLHDDPGVYADWFDAAAVLDPEHQF